ncbi:MAG: hypothetical protein JWO22_2602 [Frankiales bacterium]|nr:hypothetical protein [Frankiales bacterium]
MSARRLVVAGLVVVGLAAGLGAASLRHSPTTTKVAAAPALPATTAADPPAPGPAAVVAVPRKAPPVKPAIVRSKPAAKPTHVAVAHVTRPRPVVKAKPAALAAKPKPVVHKLAAETPNQRGQRVLASLHYNWQRLGYKVVFKPERKGYLGYTDGTTKTVTIWVRTRETDVVLAHTIGHELGHVLDFTHGNDAKHALYLSLRGISPTTPWYGCYGCTDYRTPAGDWAEVFAYWLAGPGDFRSEMGPPPSKAKMAAIAALYKF